MRLRTGYLLGRSMAGTTALERALLAAVAAAIVLAGVSATQGWAPVPAFVLATAALLGLAWVVTFATEQVGGHLGPAITGVLQATLANLPELFVIWFALSAGELVVAQTAIVGSMLANGLLLMGVVMIVGARRAGGGTMRFAKKPARDMVTVLLVMVFAVVVASPALGIRDDPTHLRSISVVGACCMLAVYLAWLTGSLRRARGEAVEGGESRLGLAAAMGLLVAGGVGSAFVSEWFVNSLGPAIEILHISRPFAGLVIVGIAGNAVEHAASVVLAARGRSELAVSVVVSSVGQIAGFLFPVLVLVSLALTTQLTLALSPVYIGALGLMTLMTWLIAGDGEATAFEGLALVALYVVVAVVAIYQ